MVCFEPFVLPNFFCTLPSSPPVHHSRRQAGIHRHRALAVDRLSAVHHSRRQASHGALAVGAIHLHCVPADDMDYSRAARYGMDGVE